VAGYDTNVQVHKILDLLLSSQGDNIINIYYTNSQSLGHLSVEPASIKAATNCPPPSRIFHGRQAILDKMHFYFTQTRGKQQVYLLYGIGGIGKTQIAFKFIEESSNRCVVNLPL
jgi:hypothetical protein